MSLGIWDEQLRVSWSWKLKGGRGRDYGRIPPANIAWLKEWYQKHLKEWAENYLAELAKVLIILLGLIIFRVVLLAAKASGMDPGQVAMLEDLHFWSSYATFGILVIYSIFSWIGSMLR